MSVFELAAGFALGMLGAAGHLAVVALRVRLACGGAPGRALIAMPVGLAIPALMVVAAARLAPAAAWAALPGMIAMRTLVLDRAGRR